MRRILIIAAAFVVASGLAYSGDYHSGTTLICSDCHVMHAQTSHDYGDPATYTFTPVTPPQHYLLKGPINDMCLACHDQSTAADVLGNDSRGVANRSAGALNKVGLSIDSTYRDHMGHSLGSTAVAPGGSFQNADGLTCIDCHHQHGYAGFGTTDVGNSPGAGNSITSSYRNVRAFGGLTISYSIGTNNLLTDVYETAPRMYETINVNLNEPNLADSGVATWCGGCHGSFHGAVGDPNTIGGVINGTFPEEFIRHPNATVNIGDLGGGHSSLGVFEAQNYRVRVMSADGVWGPLGAAWDTSTLTDGVTPTCLSCHKAHGNGRPFGLIYADGTGSATEGVTENGQGTQAKDLCKQCHVQG